MYFVDRRKIEDTLMYMRECIHLFSKHEQWESPLEQMALERIAQMLMESVIDVGNQMIDGFIMRDPGGYADIIDILCDERVIATGDGQILKTFIRQRSLLVRGYTSVDHRALVAVVEKSLPALEIFEQSVRRYLHEELGPVSAFLPEDKGNR